MAGRGKVAGTRDLAPRIRQAFDKAVDNLRKGGTITDMADLFEEMLAQDPFKAFELIAKFVPKEHMIDQEVTHRIISGDAVSAEEWMAEHGIEPPAEPPTAH